MSSIAFCTLGCKVNQADTAGMELLFRNAGFEIRPFGENADVCLINTCVVTNTGQRKSRQLINRAIRMHPGALIVVTGCYPQTASAEVASLPGVDIMMGNQDRAKVVEVIQRALMDKQKTFLSLVRSWDENVFFDEMPAGDVDERTRAFLKIQEGCNQFCTYCIIPYARGRLRSRSLGGITEQTAKLVSRGYKEIVLIGIHLGCYGKETGKYSLADAVKAALDVSDLQRLRLGSLESVEADSKLLELMKKDKRFCHHLHLPLQSGCDRILQGMHRPYTCNDYLRLVTLIRETVPDIAITTDVIVGFPGETEDDFLATCDFVSKAGFAKIHVFPYSRRKGTLAAQMPCQITEREKSVRVKRLSEIDAAAHLHFLEGMIGKEEEVLLEKSPALGFMEGLTGNYQRVMCPGTVAESNTVCRVHIEKIKDNVLIGRRIGGI